MANVVPFADWTRRGKWGVTLPFRRPAKGVVVHHSVTRPVESPVQSARTVEEVTYRRGSFAMIPYSYLIHPPTGVILEGRHTKWRNGANKNQRGGSFNNGNTVSVCVIGDMRRDPVTGPLRTSFQWLLNDLERRGMVVSGAEVMPHSSLSYTECPAFDIADLLIPLSGEGGEDGMKIINDTENKRMWASWVLNGTTIVREYGQYRGPEVGDPMPGIAFVIDAEVKAGRIEFA